MHSAQRAHPPDPRSSPLPRPSRPWRQTLRWQTHRRLCPPDASRLETWVSSSAFGRRDELRSASPTGLRGGDAEVALTRRRSGSQRISRCLPLAPLSEAQQQCSHHGKNDDGAGPWFGVPGQREKPFVPEKIIGEERDGKNV